tara:strand:- start:121 stop:345 length:225 start_codon:yes stop_codon:yes gene_type:complete
MKKRLDHELSAFQEYIDEGYFDYDIPKDITLGFKDMTVKEVLEKIKGWDFSPYDNLIWHYSRIDLLRQLIREEE